MYMYICIYVYMYIVFRAFAAAKVIIFTEVSSSRCKSFVVSQYCCNFTPNLQTL